MDDFITVNWIQIKEIFLIMVLAALGFFLGAISANRDSP